MPIVAIHFEEYEWLEPVYVKTDDPERFKQEILPKLLEETIRRLIKKKYSLDWWSIVEEFRKLIKERGMAPDVTIVSIYMPIVIEYVSDKELKAYRVKPVDIVNNVRLGELRKYLSKEFIEELKQYLKREKEREKKRVREAVKKLFKEK